jgi:hypothetical protein
MTRDASDVWRERVTKESECLLGSAGLRSVTRTGVCGFMAMESGEYERCLSDLPPPRGLIPQISLLECLSNFLRSELAVVRPGRRCVLVAMVVISAQGAPDISGWLETR